MSLVSELLAQIRMVQREEGGMSKLATQHNTEPRVTPLTFPENIPRKDTSLGIRKVTRGLTKERGLRRIL